MRTRPRGRSGRSPWFTEALFVFLEELRLHNDRDWFERNKARYLADVRDPMLRFIADVGPVLKRLAPRLVADPRPVGGSLFRIHRDTRFAREQDFLDRCVEAWRPLGPAMKLLAGAVGLPW